MRSTVNEDRITAILAEVEREVRRAIAEHAPMHSPHEGYAVILEEADELWVEIKADAGRELPALEEAVQVAAMGVRYVLDMAAADDEAAAAEVGDE